MSVSAGELANRIRAARAYARLSQPELANRLGVGRSTLVRIELEQRGLKDFEQHAILDSIAKICGLPPAFFTADFKRLERPPRHRQEPDLQAAIQSLHAKLDELLTRSAPREPA
jgi:transcriptional regulator with XRE-family HTH domain